jgi:hypothetical protein
VQQGEDDIVRGTPAFLDTLEAAVSQSATFGSASARESQNKLLYLAVFDRRGQTISASGVVTLPLRCVSCFRYEHPQPTTHALQHRLASYLVDKPRILFQVTFERGADSKALGGALGNTAEATLQRSPPRDFGQVRPEPLRLNISESHRCGSQPGLKVPRHGGLEVEFYPNRPGSVGLTQPLRCCSSIVTGGHHTQNKHPSKTS